jgi:cyclophilin family peptidyl-prolyl cis-trans isomerase
MFKFIFHLILVFILTSCFDETKDDSFLIESASSLKEQNLRLKTVHGDIIIKLHSKEAPSTVGRIVSLTNKGFYNGLTFHKVIPNFILQTGDPLGTGEGGSGQKLKLELSNLEQQPGAVSIARQISDPNSGDSQFFICLDACEEVGGNYTIFGQVIIGLDIAKKIQKKDKIINMSIE